jgi:hypothetical protein
MRDLLEHFHLLKPSVLKQSSAPYRGARNAEILVVQFSDCGCACRNRSHNFSEAKFTAPTLRLPSASGSRLRCDTRQAALLARADWQDCASCRLRPYYTEMQLKGRIFFSLQTRYSRTVTANISRRKEIPIYPGEMGTR